MQLWTQVTGCADEQSTVSRICQGWFVFKRTHSHLSWHVLNHGLCAKKGSCVKCIEWTKISIRQIETYDASCKPQQLLDSCQPRGDAPGIIDERCHLRYVFEYLEPNRDERIAICFVKLQNFAFLYSYQNFFKAPGFFVFFVGFSLDFFWHQRVDRVCLCSNISQK